MLKRPSSRRKSHSGGIELNLVPILDAMVTLIGFLLFTTSFLVIVSIESPLPQSSPQEVQQQLKEKPLQLTVSLEENHVMIWSPFKKIDAQNIPNKDNEADLTAIHEALIQIKKQFPNESSIVIVPQQRTPYDKLIALMDSIRSLESTDPTLYIKNEKTGNDEPSTALFPKVVFGNLLGES